MRKAVRPRELDPVALVDPNDTREPCPGRKGVELASEIRHAADASGCVHPAAEARAHPGRALPLLVTFPHTGPGGRYVPSYAICWPRCDAERPRMSPTTISQSGTRRKPKNQSGVRSDAPMTIDAQASGFGSIPLRRAPRPVASSTAAKAAFHASQSYE
jgi:hypothetical protein